MDLYGALGTASQRNALMKKQQKQKQSPGGVKEMWGKYEAFLCYTVKLTYIIVR